MSSATPPLHAHTILRETVLIDTYVYIQYVYFSSYWFGNTRVKRILLSVSHKNLSFGESSFCSRTYGFINLELAKA